MRVGEEEMRRQETQILPPQGRRHTVDLPQVITFFTRCRILYIILDLYSSH